jgi:hypothetical protein
VYVGVTDTRDKDPDFENQVAAVDARWRTSVGGGRSSPVLAAEMMVGLAARGPQNLLASPGGGHDRAASASLRYGSGPWEVSASQADASGAGPTAWRLHTSVLRSF